MTPLAFLRELVARGMSWEAAAEMADAFEASIAEAVDAATAATASAPAQRERSQSAERQARYRERLRDRGMTGHQWRKKAAAILVRDDHACRYCGAAATHCDHVQPLSQEGTNDDWNLVAACADCNFGKSGRTLEEWRGEGWAREWLARNGDITRYATPVIQRGVTPPLLDKEKSPTPPKEINPTPSPVRPLTRSNVPTPVSKFDEFWLAYPRKIGKGAARKSYPKALSKVRGDDPHAALMAALATAKRAWAGTDPQFIPHAATWLNQDRWEDEPLAHGPAPPTASEMKPVSEEYLAQRRALLQGAR